MGAAACWCRTCDEARRNEMAAAGASPSELIALGSRFIVCPDCGNKRCPKATNHALACTNSNESGQKGSEWEHIKPAAFVLQPERLAAIARCQQGAVEYTKDEVGKQSEAKQYAEDIGELLAHIAALTTYTKQAEGRVREMQEKHREEVLGILRDMRLPLLPTEIQVEYAGPMTSPLHAGQNIERRAINTYCRAKAYEYSSEGIGPDPTEAGQWDTLPKNAPLPAPAAGEDRKEGASKFFLNGDPAVNPFGPR